VEADITIPARDGYEIPIRVHKPQSIPTDGCPLVVMYHGGGFCLGDLDTETLNCRAFVNHFNAVCLNVDYRLAPEWPFPVAINDAWDALQWTAANYRTSRYLAGVAPRERGFVVGGNSAGANITAVLTHLARDAQMNPPITG
jgi:acetyl esterase/lipase